MLSLPYALPLPTSPHLSPASLPLPSLLRVSRSPNYLQMFDDGAVLTSLASLVYMSIDNYAFEQMNDDGVCQLARTRSQIVASIAAGAFRSTRSDTLATGRHRRIWSPGARIRIPRNPPSKRIAWGDVFRAGRRAHRAHPSSVLSAPRTHAVRMHAPPAALMRCSAFLRDASAF